MEPLEKNKEDFYHVKGLRRVRYWSVRSTIITILSALLMIIALIIAIGSAFPELTKFFKELMHLSELLISSAYAADGSNVSYANGYKPIINLIIMSVLGITFVWSLVVSLHSENEERNRRASDINKMILGFLLGSAKSYLGL